MLRPVDGHPCGSPFSPLNQTLVRLTRPQMTPPPTEPSKQPTSAGTQVSKILKFSKQQLALAFAIAGISDAIGAFATPLPPIVWVVDLGTALAVHGAGPAANVLNRTFEAPAPNRKWIADFTYIWTAEGWLYVAAAVRSPAVRV